jgi:hypothetical protein
MMAVSKERLSAKILIDALLELNRFEADPSDGNPLL